MPANKSVRTNTEWMTWSPLNIGSCYFIEISTEFPASARVMNLVNYVGYSEYPKLLSRVPSFGLRAL